METSMEPITLDHVRQAAEWAMKAASEPQPIDGLTRKYRQSDWDCGTSCCMWGAASIMAGCGPAKEGPSSSKIFLQNGSLIATSPG